MTEYECPICGATTKGNGEPFDSKDSVAAHIQSSTGEHRGVGYEKAHMLLETDESEAESDDETDNNESGGTSDPAKAAPETDPQTDTPESGDPGNCPDCDGELIDFRDRETWQRNGRIFDTPDEFYCSRCGKGWNDE